jgi:hypothetical protein
MGKHTDGPWHVGSRIDCQSTRICTIVGGDAIHGSSAAVSEWRNDAALIAAAPDLLEALTDALEDYDAWMKDADVTPNESLLAWTDKARSAIARAKGEE